MKWKHIFYVQKLISENLTVNEIMPKNMVAAEGPQITSQYGAQALRDGSVRLHARMSISTPTRPGTHINAGTHARTLESSSNLSPICW
jgi:hypothetical protein